MANTINLGPMPVLDGISLDSSSLYVGNNRFVRIISQRDPDHVVAVMSESSDINDPLQTLSVLKEQIIIPNTYLNNIKLIQLGNGKILISGAVGGTILYFYVLSYDDINSEFVLERTHNTQIFSDNYLSLGPINTSYIIEPFGVDSIYMSKFTNPSQFHFKIDGLDTDTPTHVTLGSHSSADTYFINSAAGIRVVDDKVQFINSTHYDYSGSMYDVNTNTPSYSYASYAARQIKMDVDRYVLLTQVGTTDLKFKVSESLISSGFSANLSTIGPTASYGSPNNNEDIFDFVGVDRQHLIFFWSPRLDTRVYCRFLKIVDGNYGFLSENSQIGNGIEVCTIDDETSRNQHSNGRLVNQIDATHFWIQSNKHEFVFLTMSI